MIRNILKGIMLVIIVALAFGIGYYFNDKKENSDKISVDSKKSYKKVALSDSEKIEINNKLNDHSNTPLSYKFSWVVPSVEYNFSDDTYKLLFLKSSDYEYGNIVINTDTNKTYYKLSAVQEKSEKYFNEKIKLKGDEEYYSDSEEYKDYMYINTEVSYDEHMECPTFKIKNVLYDEKNDLYILNIDILDGDINFLNSMEELNNEEPLKDYSNDNLNYDKKYIYASGIMKFKKIDNEYYIKSFELKK